MRTWVRARLERRCGRCAKPIRVGEPMLELRLVVVASVKVRCKDLACAGEPVPAELPEFTPPVPVDMTRIGLLPLAFERLQVEREPGQEG